MAIEIRQVHLADLPYLYDICLKTALSGADATSEVSDKIMTGQCFVAPYVHYEIDVCYVLTLNHLPMGYIVGTSSSADFCEWMNSYWLPQLRLMYPETMSPLSDFESFVINTINRDWQSAPFLTDYPAHLHINLLPEIQGRGLGRKLMITFVNQLKNKGVRGLHLSVGGKNNKAIAFYEKNGFSVLRRPPGAVDMGLKF